MSDATLLMIGCAVTFTAVAGAYLVIRESYTGESRPSAARAPVKNQRPARGPRPVRRNRVA